MMKVSLPARLFALVGVGAVASAMLIPPSDPASPTVLVTRSNNGHGTGVHVGGGRILTAGHLIEEGVTLSGVRAQDGQLLPILAVHRFDNDLAVVQVAGEPAGRATLVCDRDAEPDERVVHEGYPLVGTMQRYHGQVASKVYNRGDYKMAPVTAYTPIGQIYNVFWTYGSSGGGVYQEGSYRMVAMAIAMFGDDPIRLAVPARTICEHLKALDTIAH